MSASIHLAAPDDAVKLLPMIEAFHLERGVRSDVKARAAAIAPLLEGSPHGALWLIGPRAAPVGYIAITFGWSLASGGLTGTIDEFYVRETVRGRGVGSEVLIALMAELETGGVTALHIAMVDEDDRMGRMYKRLGFKLGAPHRVLSWRCATGA
ncbi:MAG: GNAT family N-acetyltransferase [Pseudomonadota bacterium]